MSTPDQERVVPLLDDLDIEVLPDQTSDDIDLEYRPGDDSDDRLLADRPPHWDA